MSAVPYEMNVNEVWRRYQERVAAGATPSYGLFTDIWYQVFGGYNAPFGTYTQGPPDVIPPASEGPQTSYGTPANSSTTPAPSQTQTMGAQVGASPEGYPIYDSMPDQAPNGGFVVGGVTYNDPNRGVMSTSPYSVPPVGPPDLANQRIQNILDHPLQPGDPGYEGYKWATQTPYGQAQQTGLGTPQTVAVQRPGGGGSSNGGGDVPPKGLDGSGGGGDGWGKGDFTDPVLPPVNTTGITATPGVGQYFAWNPSLSDTAAMMEPRGAALNILAGMGADNDTYANPWAARAAEISASFPWLFSAFAPGAGDPSSAGAVDFFSNLMANITNSTGLGLNDPGNPLMSYGELRDLFGSLMAGNGPEAIQDIWSGGSPTEVQNLIESLMGAGAFTALNPIAASNFKRNLQKIIEQYGSLYTAAGDYGTRFGDFASDYISDFFNF